MAFCARWQEPGLWGVSGACAQYLFAHYGITPMFATAVRSLVASCVFLGMLACRKRALLRQMLRCSTRTKLAFLAFGAIGSVTGSLLGAIEPVSASVCAWAFLGTAFSGFNWAGLALMLGMLALVALGSKPQARKQSIER